MGISTFLCHLALVLLIIPAWSIPAFCGEIHEAAEAGDLVRVKALLKDNAELVLGKDSDSRTPLHCAIAPRHQDVRRREMLLSLMRPDDAVFKAATPLYKDVVELLLAYGAQVNAKDKDGRMPLHLAAMMGNKDIADLLLAKKVDVNAKDKDGWTPLLVAAENGHKDLVELLLAHGADANAKDPFGQTPLHWAAMQGKYHIVELLLANKAKVNVRDIIGDTPLRDAVRRNHTDVAELLRQHGGH